MERRLEKRATCTFANIAAISLDGGEAPEAVAGPQFPLFKMLADLLDSDVTLPGACIDMAVVRQNSIWYEKMMSFEFGSVCQGFSADEIVASENFDAWIRQGKWSRDTCTVRPLTSVRR